MKFELLLLMCVNVRCLSLRLGPLENNDKLQDITKLYVAEWQWESWPQKQKLAEQEGRSPGQRKNFALWRDNSKSAWYLFGGESINGDPKNVHSDVWQFTVKTRVWKKFLPSQSKLKSEYINTKGGMNTPQPVFIHESNAFYSEPANHKMILCGGLLKKNLSTKSEDLWSNFRRKKFEKEKPEEKLSYIAIYAQKTSKSNTVWQIDVREKIWTAYVCCCDKQNATFNLIKKWSNKTKIFSSNKTLGKSIDIFEVNATRNLCAVLDSQIDNAEDKVDNEQQHLRIADLKNKKKKINQFKTTNKKPPSKVINPEKKSGRKGKNVNETIVSSADENPIEKNNALESVNNSKTDIKASNNENFLKLKNATKLSEGEVKNEMNEKVPKLKVSSKYCPKFSEDGARLTWCDRKNEAFVTVGVSPSLISFWVFDLKTKQWTQVQVKDYGGVKWWKCANINSIRHAGDDEEVYIICSQLEKQTDASKTSFINSTNPSKIPSETNFNTKLVYKINYRERVLRSFGKIKFNSYFNSPDGEKVWQNDTLSILKVFKNSENETILVLAYLDIIDLWILNRNQKGEDRFDLMEKIWRGSALKWFDKYNAVLYSLQFVSESGDSETILLPNPRNIRASDYWPKERGRFIIRIFRNENLKNQSFENRTREQNLTYELLQSDFRPSGSEHHLNQMYSLKVVVFFGISLTIFTVFGFVVFLKKCVNCPPRIRIRNECHKSPLVIRYSVIPDDLLYPVT